MLIVVRQGSSGRAASCKLAIANRCSHAEHSLLCRQFLLHCSWCGDDQRLSDWQRWIFTDLTAQRTEKLM